jgi:nucleoside-diphosphate-sugar epimerase
MRILVTGASGFIGSGVVARLTGQGHDVCALMRPTASSEYLKGVKFTRLSGDLHDPASLVRACENIDVVIHLAGLTSSTGNREEFFRFNAVGTKNLAEAAVQAKTPKKFIYVSTQAASGPSSSLSPKTESEPDRPVSMYGESKLRGELYLDEFKGQLPFIVLRPPSVYGPRDRNIFIFFKMIQKQWMPVLPCRTPTGHKYYNFIHVEDLIEVIVQSINAPDEHYRNGERYFVTDGQIYTMERVMSLIAQELKTKPIKIKVPVLALAAITHAGSILGRVLKKNLKVNRDRMSELLPDYWICSSQKAMEQLQFKPKYTLETGIPQTVAWYKVQGWL